MSMKKAFGWGVFIWVLYILSRFCVQHFYPANTYGEFIRQDIFITGFRLLLLYFMLALARLAMSRKELGFQRGPVWPAAIAGLLFISIDLIRLAPWVPVQAKPIYFILEMAINLLVAVNEEISFRGLFYVCMREMKGENWAIYFVSALFALMHWGYQSLAAFPSIFLTGVAFAKLRSMGVSLTVLILIHWVLDFLYFIFPPYHNQFPIPLFTAMHLVPLGVVFGWDYLQKRRIARTTATT